MAGSLGPGPSLLPRWLHVPVPLSSLWSLRDEEMQDPEHGEAQRSQQPHSLSRLLPACLPGPRPFSLLRLLLQSLFPSHGFLARQLCTGLRVSVVVHTAAVFLGSSSPSLRGAAASSSMSVTRVASGVSLFSALLRKWPRTPKGDQPWFPFRATSRGSSMVENWPAPRGHQTAAAEYAQITQGILRATSTCLKLLPITS